MTRDIIHTILAANDNGPHVSNDNRMLIMLRLV